VRSVGACGRRLSVGVTEQASGARSPSADRSKRLLNDRQQRPIGRWIDGRFARRSQARHDRGDAERRRKPSMCLLESTTVGDDRGRSRRRQRQSGEPGVGSHWPSRKGPIACWSSLWMTQRARARAPDLRRLGGCERTDNHEGVGTAHRNDGARIAAVCVDSRPMHAGRIRLYLHFILLIRGGDAWVVGSWATPCAPGDWTHVWLRRRRAF